jgi:hypothetical protein
VRPQRAQPRGLWDVWWRHAPVLSQYPRSRTFIVKSREPTTVGPGFTRQPPAESGTAPPLDARSLGEQRLQAFLKRHGYTGRKPTRELLARLRDGAEGRPGELEIKARRQIVLALASALEPIVARISELTIQNPPRPGRALRRRHVPLAVYRSGLVAVRRDDDRRDRRLPRALPHLPRARRQRRPSPSRRRMRQSQTRPVPLGLRPPTTRRFCTLADASRRHNPWADDRPVGTGTDRVGETRLGYLLRWFAKGCSPRWAFSAVSNGRR